METGSVATGEFQLQYFQHGTGPEEIVLVHGYSSSARIWRLAQEALATDRFHSTAISNRGAGDSDRSPLESDYTAEAFARDLFPAIQALGLRDFTLVGHSMGGATVTQFALNHPELIKGLVLLNPAPLSGRTLPENWEEQIQAQFSSRDTTGDVGAGHPGTPEDFRRALQADVARNPIERAIGGRRSMSQLRLRERLKELRMPVMVVGGDRDTTVGVDNIVAEYLALPEDRRSLHIYHGVGHSPNVEVAVSFAGVLTRFISEAIPQLTGAAAAVGD